MADPTVGDVFDQLVMVNAKLDQIQTNTLPLTAGINQVKAAIQTGLQSTVDSINNLDTDVKNGFKGTIEVLLAIAQIEIETTKLIYHLTQQTDTMICSLEHISKNTCGILTQTTLQTPIQASISDDTKSIRDVAESAYPQAVLGRERLERLRAEIEKCCPPAVVPPACQYEKCPAPPPAKEPVLPKIPPARGGEQPGKNQEKLVAEVVDQVASHLPIKSFDALQRSVPQIQVLGQRVPLKMLAPHATDGLFPIDTKEDLTRKVNASLVLARALAESQPIESIQGDLLPAVVVILQQLGADPLPRGPLGASGQPAIYGSPNKKGAK